jgi:hypothetical protein
MTASAALLGIALGYYTATDVPVADDPVDKVLALQGVEQQRNGKPGQGLSPASVTPESGLSFRELVAALKSEIIPAVRAVVASVIQQHLDEDSGESIPADPILSRALHGEPATPPNDQSAMNDALMVAEQVLARAVDQGIWTEGYDREYNRVFDNVSDEAWAEGQRRLAAAINDGTITPPEDFLPGQW